MLKGNQVGENIRKIRIDKGLKQDYVAEQLGIAQNNYGKLERGETKVTLDKLKKLAEIFEVDEFTIMNYHKLKGNSTNPDLELAYQLKLCQQENAFKDKEIMHLQKEIDYLKEMNTLLKKSPTVNP